MRRDKIFWWHELFRASFRNRAERLTTSKLHVVQHLQIWRDTFSPFTMVITPLPRSHLTGACLRRTGRAADRHKEFAGHPTEAVRSEIEQVAFAKFSSRPIGSLAIDLFLEFFAIVLLTDTLVNF